MRTTSAQSSGWIISSFFKPDHCGHRRRDEAGADRDGAHAVGVELLVERARERDHRRLRRAVGREPRRRQRARDRREVHDPALRLAQERDRRLRDEEEPAHVDAHLEVEVLRGQVLDGAADADAGRVDEDVEPPELLAVLGDEPLAVGGVADVGCDRGRAELLGRGLHLLRAGATRASARSPRRGACARSRARCPTSRR